MITVKVKGNFRNTERLFKNVQQKKYLGALEKYAKVGLEALQQYTPKDTGKTAASWSYTIEKTKTGYGIYWSNSNENHGVPIAVLIQYGHLTRNGGFVHGVDYINPALKPVFEKLAEDSWKEVTMG